MPNFYGIDPYTSGNACHFPTVGSSAFKNWFERPENIIEVRCQASTEGRARGATAPCANLKGGKLTKIKN